MYLSGCLLTVSLALLATCSAQDKWVWGRTAKAVRTDSGRLRYGVYEPDGLDEPPQGLRPGYRPLPSDLPPLIRPGPGLQPPNYPRPQPPPLPQRPHAKPDLDPTHFEKCKCVHSFNCKSPGLLFGSCDTGKKYCCEKSVAGGGRRDFVPDNEDPEVLAGPGGPVDHLKRPVNVGGGRPGLGSYGERPSRTGPYGLRPDGSLGLGPGHVEPQYRPGPRYSN